MNRVASSTLHTAIACGGTGGHLFPGLAVANQLVRRGGSVTLLVSPKEVDQRAVAGVSGMEVAALPAVGLVRGGEWAFLKGFRDSYRAARKFFAERPPAAVLAMGGFTCAPPVLAGRRMGACVFLHESNAVPGRANRWLSWIVRRAFVGFPSAAAGLHNRRVTVSGTPVRGQFQRRSPAECRLALGLQPDRPVALVMGGSQGAAPLNELVRASLNILASRAPDLQWIHLAGPAGEAAAKSAFAQAGLKAVVCSFLPQMELALGAATVAVSRAGASSLAELAAMRLPAILVPYPAAADNHQFHNARAFEATGAAWLLDQKSASPETLAKMLLGLVQEPQSLARMQAALERWHAPAAAELIADEILRIVSESRSTTDRARSCAGREPRARPHSRPGAGDRAQLCLASRRVV